MDSETFQTKLVFFILVLLLLGILFLLLIPCNLMAQDTTRINIEESALLELPTIMGDVVGVRGLQVIIEYDVNYWELRECMMHNADFDIGGLKDISVPGIVELNYIATEQKTFNKPIADLIFKNLKAGITEIKIVDVKAYVDAAMTPVSQISYDYGAIINAVKYTGTKAHIYLINIY